jgi:hypothetical protein
MVFQESEHEFDMLLNKLRTGAAYAGFARTLPTKEHAAMVKLLQPLEDEWRRAEARRMSSGRAQAIRVLQHIQQRTVVVPRSFEAFGFTDFYDKDERRIDQDPKADKAQSHLYSNRFDFNYGFDEAFRTRLFGMLDEDLSKQGIRPVPGA